MDVEVAQCLLRRVSSALIRFGTPPTEPAPKLTSWEEFLRQPTAAERAAADARERQTPAPDVRTTPRPRRAGGSRRRRRAQGPTPPPRAKPRAPQSPRAAKPDDPSNATSLARTYDITVAGNSSERIKHASAPRHVTDSAIERPERPTPRHPSVTPSGPEETVNDELTTIRQLLEQLVQSQLRVESRLEALERDASAPAAQEDQSEAIEDGEAEPLAYPPSERERAVGTDGDSTEAKGERLREQVHQLQASLLAASRLLSILSARVDGLERRGQRTARRPRRCRSRPLSGTSVTHPSEERDPTRAQARGPAP